MESLSHKQGDTFYVVCQWTDPLGSPISLSGYTVKSQVRVFNSSPFVDDLSVIILDSANGLFSLTATATQTTSWVVSSGQYNRTYCDVQFTKDGIVSSTETFEIIVQKEITQ